MGVYMLLDDLHQQCNTCQAVYSIIGKWNWEVISFVCEFIPSWHCFLHDTILASFMIMNKHNVLFQPKDRCSF